MTAVVGAVVSAILYVLVSPMAALSCAVGSAIMVVNFFMLAIVGGGILALARNGHGTSRAGILLAPIKLAFLIVAVIVVVGVFKLNVPAFVAGILTQFVAIFIEVWRTAPRARLGAGAETEGNNV